MATGSCGGSDGRSPGLRVKAWSALSVLSNQWHFGRRSPLTVAGAATVSAPVGSSSPYSLFIRLPDWVGRNRRVIEASASDDAGSRTSSDADALVIDKLCCGDKWKLRLAAFVPKRVLPEGSCAKPRLNAPPIGIYVYIRHARLRPRPYRRHQRCGSLGWRLRVWSRWSSICWRARALKHLHRCRTGSPASCRKGRSVDFFNLTIIFQ